MSIERQRFRAAARIIIVNGLIVLAISAAFLWADKPANLEYPPLVGRILVLAGDSSLRDRYVDQTYTEKARGWLTEIKPHFGVVVPHWVQPMFGERFKEWLTGVILRFQMPPWIKPMFGYGLSTAYFLGGLPDNGYALIWKSFGFNGSVILLAALIMMLRPLPKGQRWCIAAGLAFVMTTYPLVTYLVLWLWLATLIIPCSFDVAAGVTAKS